MLLHTAVFAKELLYFYFALKKKIKNPHSNAHGKCTQSTGTRLTVYYWSVSRYWYKRYPCEIL